MKKKLLIGTLGAALVFRGAFAVSAAKNDDGNAANLTTKNEKTFLSTDEVKKIALQEVDGVLEGIELEKESGKAVYEVDIEKLIETMTCIWMPILVRATPLNG